MSDQRWTPEDALVVTAARMLADAQTCFVGIGLPSAAAILAQKTHARNLVLVYESGTIDPHPEHIPLSVADDELASTARTIVSVPEMFQYWIQPGRIDAAILGAGQIDQFANLNSTVVGSSYSKPRVRLPGAGGAPEIVSACRDTILMIRHTPQGLVPAVDFITSLGHGHGLSERTELGMPGRGPRAVVTDLGVFEPDPASRELKLVAVHQGATVDLARERAGWDVAVASEVRTLVPPNRVELEVLRQIQSRDPQVRA